jgi:hypothetical protein
VRILLWHVHGSWTTAFVQGAHQYVVPVLPDRGPDGRGRAQTWDWPAAVTELPPADLPNAGIDLVILQRPEEIDLCARWLGKRPGVDIPAVYLEHNAPQGRINEMKHPAAGRPGLVLVHVTHFNELFWDAGDLPTRVISHGIVDPGYLYTGELPHAAVVVNEPVRRARVTGTDLLERFAGAAPLDLFGMGVAELGGYENLKQDELHTEMGRRRVYLHTCRWTSLGLSLLEAMYIGMPVVALATTETVEAVPPEAGVISTDTGRLVQAVKDFAEDPEYARACGKAAREVALERFGLERFLSDWDRLLAEVAR